MNVFAFIFLSVVVAIRSKDFNPRLDGHWQTFKRRFNKYYGENEEIARRFVWEENVDYIIKHNLNRYLGLHSYTLGLNEYSDMSREEFVRRMNGVKRNANKSVGPAYNYLNLSNVILPDEVDWREEGLVTEVKNQKQCGSCWAFSTTGALEGQHKKKTGRLVSLSEQNLIDCTLNEGNYGCSGGFYDHAFEYVKNNGGIDTERSYPYEAKEDKCRFKRQNIGATCMGFVSLPPGDEEILKQAVATIGPISVGIDGSTWSFQLYKEGIYDDDNCSNEHIDHAVLVVGYGTENGKDYWLVKNSWGTSWGMQGYVKMARNKNQCGIATHSSYPLV
ncbi:cathepsin L1-like [Centruroides sculpturatus]|uniref:cathepsin L1-like n=1 Tax=Centruroides sculpturatus TaxID=218467 RepID=UPI000C6CCA73|nr:cathepsin L1-like [Centruroides sculpturatus]